MVDAGVHDDPVEPRCHLRIVPESIERAIDLDEDVLGDVLGVVMIAGELVGHPIHHGAMPLHQRMERGRVAGRRAGHEIRIRRRAEAAVHCQRYDGHTVVRVDRSGTLDGGFGVRGSGFGVWFGVQGVRGFGVRGSGFGVGIGFSLLGWVQRSKLVDGFGLVGRFLLVGVRVSSGDVMTANMTRSPNPEPKPEPLNPEPDPEPRTPEPRPARYTGEMPSVLPASSGMANALRRNVAIIAHVDHGKTTLVDGLLHQSGIFRSNERVAERAMDNTDLERERGITILAKNTAVHYGDTLINIVDTPGHADFGGEVERTLAMVDGVMLLVDASEGPLPQTRFVLRKALERRLPPIVVINKIDRPDARVTGSAERDLRPVHRSRRHRRAARLSGALHERQGRHLDARTLEQPGADLRPLFDAIVDHVPPPRGNPEGAAADAGRQPRFERLPRADRRRPHVQRPRAGSATPVAVCKLDGSVQETKITKLFAFEGLKRIDIDEAAAGDIVCLAGIEDITIGETIADVEHRKAMPADRGRRADGVDDLRRQHVADVGTRRPVRHLAADQGSPGQGAARQRLDPRRADRHAGADEGARPRRAAALDSDRDDAARRLRAAGLAPRHRHQGGQGHRSSSRSKTW